MFLSSLVLSYQFHKDKEDKKSATSPSVAVLKLDLLDGGVCFLHPLIVLSNRT